MLFLPLYLAYDLFDIKLGLMKLLSWRSFVNFYLLGAILYDDERYFYLVTYLPTSYTT